VQAFDDCTTLAATFKLLESFEGLLERDTIAAELAKKHLTMVTAFADDIKEVHELFKAHQEFPQLSKNSPPHSGVCFKHARSCTGAQPQPTLCWGFEQMPRPMHTCAAGPTVRSGSSSDDHAKLHYCSMPTLLVCCDAAMSQVL
jgi:hypothetical protein